MEDQITRRNLLNYNTGFIALYATLASRDVDCCLIPELPFCLDGPNGLFEFMKKRIRENGHVVIVIAEGAGKDLVSENMNAMEQHDIGLWISQKIKVKTHSSHVMLKSPLQYLVHVFFGV